MTAVAQVFDYNGITQIRTLIEDGEPLFCVPDVCRGLEHSNPSVALRMVEDEDKRLIDLRETDTPNLNRTSINPKMWFVTEPGFYTLALSSQAAGAKAFKRWITHDVLPAIRKTGQYKATTPDVPRSFADALQLAADQARQIEQQQNQLAITAPKAEYVDEFVKPDEDASLIRVFAAQLDVGEKALRAWLVDRKLIYRRIVGQRWSDSKQRMVPEYEWLAYADYRSWFKPVDQPSAPRLHNGQTATTLYVTPVGKVSIRRLLKQHPIANSP